jgi:AcrR family transcriptional regulator
VNLAAINYHFQSKEQLVGAIMKRLIEPINERRFQILDALEASTGGAAIDLENLLRAFLLPIFEERDTNPRRVSMPILYARMHSEPGDLIKKFFMPLIAPVVARFFPAFMKCLPGLSAVEMGWQIHFVVGATVNSMAAQQTLTALTQGDSEMEGWPAILDRLVAFCAGGLREAARRRGEQGGNRCAL